eukprot:15430175-Alexandrium_andersonii.AAC.1
MCIRDSFKVVPDATWRSPGLPPVGVIPGQEAHRSALAAGVSKAAAATHSLVVSIRPADDAGRPFGSTVRY